MRKKKLLSGLEQYQLILLTLENSSRWSKKQKWITVASSGQFKQMHKILTEDAACDYW